MCLEGTQPVTAGQCVFVVRREDYVYLVPFVEDALRAGRYALRDFLPLVRVDYVAEDELRGIRGTARSMLNVNTPEDYQRARSIAAVHEGAGGEDPGSPAG